MRLFDVAGVYAVLQFVRSKAASVGGLERLYGVSNEHSSATHIS
jgi:hypothetical protein